MLYALKIRSHWPKKHTVILFYLYVGSGFLPSFCDSPLLRLYFTYVMTGDYHFLCVCFCKQEKIKRKKLDPKKWANNT